MLSGSNCRSSTARPSWLNTPRISSAIRNARWEPREGGGFIAILPASSFTGGELKTALESGFQGQYSVQLRKDEYKITLPVKLTSHNNP
ncbi:hypothetical protein QBC33DRAFT_551808 [Phialemonium atrogriseum]|uniref:Uncharacterized protein n=1 Tax=Phialemonium atrogriseum TaxID=1093897 RepID=A0AAJ0BSG7_9PEZI|nr:uncharacterized protein QBC33DRAFT_551808 [Phialemonium atrogriseum]KAK1762558.1 hypothetical protein QBC33DRAFT_551808 [Phialemonium atrogriseum]